MIARSNTEEMKYTALLNEYLDHIRAELSPRSYENARSVLLRAHADLPLGVVRAADDEIRNWIWRPEWSAKTRQGYVSVIRGLHQWLQRRGVSDYDPTTPLPKIRTPRRLPRPVTDDELQRVLSATRAPVRLWSTIAAYSGARCVEIFRLDRRDITGRETRLFGKGDRERVVPTHPVLWDAVAGLPPGRLVIDVANPKRLSERCEKEYNRIGLPEVTLHRLRHWFATMVLAGCGDLRVVQELLGHANIANTAIYTAVLGGRFRDAIATLPTWDDGAAAAAARSPAGADAAGTAPAAPPAPAAAAGPAVDGPRTG